MSDLARTIKLIMYYISKKQNLEIKDNTSINSENCLILTIKKKIYFLETTLVNH